jgi:hypothetical protein
MDKIRSFFIINLTIRFHMVSVVHCIPFHLQEERMDLSSMLSYYLNLDPKQGTIIQK